MIEAFAAEAAAGQAEPFYATADFWVLVAFVLFFALTGRVIYRVITVALDDRSDRIRQQLDEAERLATEAQEMLAGAERRQREAEAEAEEVIYRARQEAERISERAAADLENALKRREQLAMERLAFAEQTALAEVRARAVDLAIEATRRYLETQAEGKRADALIDATIKDLPNTLKMH
ncbi:MAG: F0F1 ATP synthase subunit B [Rhodospirillales bacterium]|nr:MAG: F0F1 ATP synthase subunit B [Rhodospirillales bacterium]